LALFFSVAAVLFLLGGLIQINPIWLWGPYHVGEGTNGAQPDWYLGWLIGALRLVPSFDLVIANRTVVPNPFWGGALFPLIVMGALLAWPWLERRVTGDYAFHNLLERPRDRPWRTAIGVAFLTWVVLIFMTGSADQAYVTFGISYVGQIWAYRIAIWVLPLIVLFVTRRICLSLAELEPIDQDRHPDQETGGEEAEVLGCVHGGVGEGGLVQRREMPGIEGNRPDRERDQRMGQDAEAADHGQGEDRPQDRPVQAEHDCQRRQVAQ